MIELLPCPFCGSTNVKMLRVGSYTSGLRYVDCLDCMMTEDHFPFGPFDDEVAMEKRLVTMRLAATKRWNKRTMTNAITPYQAVAHVLQYFAYDHLPAHLQAISRPFGELAKQCADRAPNSQETAVALRKLLEAKDAAVRAALEKK